MTTPISFAQESKRPEFDTLLTLEWRETFSDNGNENWEEHWFVDGHKATLSNSSRGMFFAAGPIAKDNASHAVLWSRASYNGDLKLEFDYTRMDTVDRYVCIIYLYATGSGPEPYVEDISKWNAERQIPFMATYFDHMNLLHISFAAFGNKPDAGKDSAYIRTRRYPRSLFEGSFKKMEMEPDYPAIGLFEPGVKHHITVIKKGGDLFMNVKNDAEERLYYWDLTQIPNLDFGRIGFRHMCQRAAIYQNITVSQLASKQQP